MSTHDSRTELTSTRIRSTTRDKLVVLSEIDKRSPVLELDFLVDQALRGHGVDPDNLNSNPTHGGGNDKAQE